MMYFRILFRLRQFDEWVLLILSTQKSDYCQFMSTVKLSNCPSASWLDEVVLRGLVSLLFLSLEELVPSRVTPGGELEWRCS